MEALQSFYKKPNHVQYNTALTISDGNDLEVRLERTILDLQQSHILLYNSVVNGLM